MVETKFIYAKTTFFGLFTGPSSGLDVSCRITIQYFDLHRTDHPTRSRLIIRSWILSKESSIVIKIMSRTKYAVIKSVVVE